LTNFRGGGLDIVSLVALIIAFDLTKDILTAVRFIDNGVVKAQGVHISDGVFQSHANHLPVFLVFDFLIALSLFAALSQDID